MEPPPQQGAQDAGPCVQDRWLSLGCLPCLLSLSLLYHVVPTPGLHDEQASWTRTSKPALLFSPLLSSSLTWSRAWLNFIREMAQKSPGQHPKICSQTGPDTYTVAALTPSRFLLVNFQGLLGPSVFSTTSRGKYCLLMFFTSLLDITSPCHTTEKRIPLSASPRFPSRPCPLAWS